MEYTPTIVVCFYSDESILMAKYEGAAEIRQAIVTDRISNVIKEFMKRRAALKMVERVAHGLMAVHLHGQLMRAKR